MANSLDKKVSKNGLIYSLIALTAVVGAFAYFANFPASKDNYLTQERNVTDNSDDYLSCGR